MIYFDFVIGFFFARLARKQKPSVNPIRLSIQKRGLTKTGEAVWARYDPPYMPWFRRRNEVLIPMEKF